MKNSMLGLVLAVMVVLALFLAGNASAENNCTGKSCQPLPTKAQACYGPAAEKNPHCKPQSSNEPTTTPTATLVAVKTELPKNSPTAVPPTYTPSSFDPTKNGTEKCVNGVCPDVACSLATVAAAQATSVSLQTTALQYQATIASKP